jgi:hypothetical protein
MMDFNFPVITDNYGTNTSNDNNPPPQYILKDEDGNEVAFFAMMEMSLNSGSQLPSEPIEKGSFANYNRIIDPYEGTCRLALTGSESDIQTALDGLEELKKGLTKVEFITPFSSYENLMLESYDYRRDSHSGFDVLQVDVRLKEIREVESAKTTTSVEEPPEVTQDASADASCVSTEDGGQYQTSAPTSAETEASESEPRKQSIAYGIKQSMGW